MNIQEAKTMATQFIVDCLISEEAGGYQESERAAWYSQNPSFDQIDLDSSPSFVVTVAGHRFKFRPYYLGNTEVKS